jgi:hypothetical protein
LRFLASKEGAHADQIAAAGASSFHNISISVCSHKLAIPNFFPAAVTELDECTISNFLNLYRARLIIVTYIGLAIVSAVVCFSIVAAIVAFSIIAAIVAFSIVPAIVALAIVPAIVAFSIVPTVVTFSIVAPIVALTIVAPIIALTIVPAVVTFAIVPAIAVASGAALGQGIGPSYNEFPSVVSVQPNRENNKQRCYEHVSCGCKSLHGPYLLQPVMDQQ